MSKVVSYITDDNTLLVVVDEQRFYEFRDLTAKDILWIDHLSQADNGLDIEDYINTLAFLLQALRRMLINFNADIENEEWKTFIAINKEVQKNIFTNRIDWFDFLGFVFAAGNKSFSAFAPLLDVPLTNIRDMNDTIRDYYEEQKRMMDAAEGRVR